MPTSKHLPSHNCTDIHIVLHYNTCLGFSMFCTACFIQHVSYSMFRTACFIQHVLYIMILYIIIAIEYFPQHVCYIVCMFAIHVCYSCYSCLLYNVWHSMIGTAWLPQRVWRSMLSTEFLISNLWYWIFDTASPLPHRTNTEVGLGHCLGSCDAWVTRDSQRPVRHEIKIKLECRACIALTDTVQCAYNLVLRQRFIS